MNIELTGQKGSEYIPAEHVKPELTQHDWVDLLRMTKRTCKRIGASYRELDGVAGRDFKQCFILVDYVAAVLPSDMMNIAKMPTAVYVGIYE